jgi:hypothetical protein
MNQINDGQTIKAAAVKYRDDLYPRFKPNPQAIQQYANNIDRLPPIEVNQDGILIDGYHRWKAHETAGIQDIPCVVTVTASDMELLLLAVERNATHGQQLTQDEKRRYAARWFDVLDPDKICAALSISRRTFSAWTQDKQKQREEEIRSRILSMHLRCHTQQQIADAVGVSVQSVNNQIADFSKNGKFSDFGVFGDFEGEGSGRQIYTVWNFAKATNEVRHFGNIPPEIADNLLYLYTKPFDIVFDPFGGGGSTLDMCEKRYRRCYISDLNPIPAREQDIRRHDITTGLPGDLPVPDLVILDPPYWQQAKEKYSADATDLGNVDLETFLETVGSIARDIKRKWVNAKRETGHLALIIGPWKSNGEKLDLPFLCYERITKYLPLCERVIVPYSTQVHGGNFVKLAKEKRELLYLHRDLMVFRYGV